MTRYFNKALIVLDGSYLMHFSIHSALKRWSWTKSNAALIKTPEETDQDNLPDLTKYSDFCRHLEEALVRKLENIDSIVQAELDDQVQGIDYVNKVFALDSPIYNNWRKKIFPEYKAQRAVALKTFDIGKAMAYAENLLRNKLKIEEQGYVVVKLDGCEGDDIIASALQSFNDYKLKVLIASDRDFLQLEGVHQFDLFGAKKEILPKICEKLGVTLSPKEYLAVKVLVGDGADNIAGCFSGVGEVRAVKLVKDPTELKKRLTEDANAAKQFLLNKKIISFEFIPEDIRQQILEVIGEGFYNNEAKQAKPIFDTNDLMFL